MHPTTSLFPLLPALSLLLAPANAKAIPRDASTAVALASGYTDDNCEYPPFGDYVLDFEPSGVGQCVGNGTVAKGIYVEQLSAGCVVNAYTYANCTGEHYRLDAVGCWVQFEVGNEDLGVQGLSVTCDGGEAASSSSASASDAAGASDTASASASAGASDTASASASDTASASASASVNDTASASASASATNTEWVAW